MEANRVPAAPVAAVIREWVATQDDHSKGHDGRTWLAFDGPLKTLADRVGVNVDTLDSYLRGERTTMEFDVADKIMCLTDNVLRWISGDLEDLYRSTPLIDGRHSRVNIKPEHRCPLSGCSNPVIYKGTGAPKKYCSRSCAMKARYEKAGRYGTKYGTCPKGHDRSPENTTMRKDGSTSCRVCRREEAAQRRADPVKYAAMLARQTERRRRLKEAA